MFFQQNRPRAKAILRIPSWKVKQPHRRPHLGQDCERLHHPSSSELLQNSSNLSRILHPPHLFEKAGGVFAGHFERLHHQASSGLLPLLQNSSNLFRILAPLKTKKNRRSIRRTFRATQPPFKFWASSPPVTLASNLSIWSWAFGPASFLMTNYVCFWTWMLGDGTCHSSIRLVTLKLGLRPSFILNEKLCLFLDLDVGRWDLSLQHWTCQLEAGPSAQLDS